MAVNVFATRTSSLFIDNDGDAVFDPGDTILVRIRITNSGSDPATGVSVTDTLSGITLVPGSVQVTPIAYDDAFNLTGNTPITISSAQGLLLNDVDPDGAGGNAGLTVVSVDTTGTQGAVAFNADGSFTFTPTTGFVGVTSFKYFVEDAQGLGNVTEGIVTLTVSGLVWYVDNTYGGENGGPDGSYLRPFTSLTPLNNSGADPDGAGDTIFVYNNGGNYTAGITLEAGQTLRGDGVGFMVNQHNIGGTERTGGVDNVTTNSVISVNGTAVTLATDNTVRGLTLDANTAASIGMADGNGSVTTNGGTLTVSNVSFTGLGQAVDIDQGGNLNVSIDSLTSSGSSAQGIHLAGTASSGTGLISGTFGVTAGHIQSSTGTGVLLGAAGGGTAGSGGNVNFTYGGDISSPGASLVEIQDRTGGTATFSGNLTEGSIAGGLSGILIDQNAGTVNFNGQTFISAGGGAGNGVVLTNNSGGTINFAPTGTGLDITTANGAGLTFTGGGTLNITGSANSITTATGQILVASGGLIGSGNVTFDSLTATGVTVGNAISITNLDNNTFNGGTVSIAGSTNNGISIGLGSSSTFNFGATTIGGASNVAQNGILLDSANGPVTFTSVTINNTNAHGVSIQNATNSVTINGGAIGATNDPGGDGVNITGGTGAVTIAATITKTTAGNVVEVENHETGNVTFSGAISATGGVNNGILVNNSNSGTIAFNGQTNLSTGGNNGVTLSNNTGGTIAFNAGGNGLDITTTTGTGFSASGGGTVTVQGSGNTITSVGGVALNINNTNIGAADVTFQSISANGGNYGIRLDTTGSAGGLHVTGTGTTDGTGGTIQNIGIRGIEAIGTADLMISNMNLTNANTVSTAGNDLSLVGANAAIWMQNVTGATLNNIDINGAADNGIVGIGVSNFVMDNSSITQAGNGAHESGIEFSNLSGTSSISNTTITFSETNGLDIVNTDVNLNLTLNNVSFTDTQRVSSGGAVNSNGQGGFQFRSFSSAAGAPVTDINILDSDFDRNRTQGIQIVGEDDSIVNVDITNNNIRSEFGEGTPSVGIGAGIDINGNDTSTVTFNIIGNTIQSRNGHAVNVTSFGDANVMGRVNGNTTTANAAGSGVRFVSEGTSGMIVEARNNVMTSGPGNASSVIDVLAREGSSRLDLTLDNNTLDSDVTALATINIVSGSSASGETTQIFANIINNDVIGSLGVDSSSQLIRLRVSDLDGSSDPRIFLTGFVEGGPGTEDDAVATWNANANTPAANTGNIVVSLTGTATPISAGTANVPTNPMPSMVAAPPAPPADDGVDQTSGQGGESREPAGDDGGDTVSGGGDSGGVDQTSGQGGETGEPAGDGGDPPATIDDGIISEAELAAMVEAAIQRWIDAGASAEQIAAMRATSVTVIDMAGLYVGSSSPGTILIDSDGAGYGWFVDMTPLEDSEFEGAGTLLTADVGGAAEGRIDLLTVIMHELGHQIGLGDIYQHGESDELMFGYMSPGVRRLPGDDDHVGAVPGSVGQTAFALTPVSVGTIPTNKTVDVFFKATIDGQTNGLITNLNNTSTISGNFTDVNANEFNALDSLTLGDTIYIDANKDGNFDSGEGISGVTLTLYADSDGNGVLEGAELTNVIATTTSGALGAYAFTGLAPGNYVVSVDASNFTGGGVLVGKLNTAGGTDPDDNVDNDDNGIAGPGGTIITHPITLAYNDEPDGTPDIDGDADADTNLTLDIGFFAPNAAPVVNNMDGDIATFIEGGSAVNLDVVGTAAALTDDQADFDGGTLTVHIGTGAVAAEDVLSASSGTVSLAAGTVTVGGQAIGTYTGGTAGADLVFTFDSNATVARVQDLIRALNYSNTNTVDPSTDTRSVAITLVDGGGTDGGAGADTTVVNVLVNVTGVNDEPSGADNGDTTDDATTLVFDAADFNTGFSDQDGNNFAGVVITTLPPGASGVIQLNGTDINAGDFITLAQLTAGDLTFVPVLGQGNTAPTFTFQVRDDGGVLNGGVDTDQSPNTFTITITPSNAAPVVDLDADDSNSVGTGYAGSYTEGGAAAAISDTDVAITDADSGDDIISATITITNPETGDKLNVGTLPGTVSVDPASTDTVLILLAAPGTSAADFEAAIEAITFSSTSDDPTDGGTNTSRSITVVVNDGDSDSAAATATISITGVNDEPAGTSATITATEDTNRILVAADFGFTDPDSADDLSEVIITGVTGGTLYVDTGADGFDPADAVSTFPVTVTAAQLAGNQVAFLATANANGAAVGTITFQVVDDSGAGNDTDTSANTLTVDVTAVNDPPALAASDTGPGSTLAYQEGDPASQLAPTAVLTDIDSPDFGGGSLTVSFQANGTTSDQLTIIAGGGITVSGTDVLYNGVDIGDVSGGANGADLVISLDSDATIVAVDALIQQIGYHNTSDNPSTLSRTVNFLVDDGDGGTSTAQANATVNFTAVNDAPEIVIGAAATTNEDTAVVLTGISVSDVDADPAADQMNINFSVAAGTLVISTTVAGGITAGDIQVVPGTGNGTAQLIIFATQDQINATLADANGLTYTPNTNVNGTDNLTVIISDNGATGDDPGLTGTTSDEQDQAQKTINITAVDDPADAVDDSNSVNENATITGASVTGNDTDVDGPAFEIEEVNGAALQDGVEITLASGAKLTVNANGTYSYNPNGKFNTLTSTSTGQTGAKNTSATDSFTYKLVNGDTATVTITVNGVASAQDRLEGDSGDDTITGTPNADLFYLVQGGNDDVSGLGGNDIFYFAGTYDDGDVVDGGAGTDIVALQGDYSAGFTLGSLTGIESLSLLAGNNTFLGDTAGNFYSYDITTIDSNVAAAAILKVNAGNLRVGENFNFNGSAETNGAFLIYGGLGIDALTGGAGNDVFFFASDRLTLGDQVNGSGGYDGVFLRGDYTIDFTSTSLWDLKFQNVENFTLVSSNDTRYASGGTDFDYDIVWNDTFLQAGQTMTINGSLLLAGETMVFDGSAETNGFLKIYGGAGNDVLTGGSLGDVIYGGGSGDTLTGGGGNDVFVYHFLTDSNSTERDGIQDFTLGDKIDLSKIDAKSGGTASDAFTFIGTAAFSNTQGELRYENVAGNIWLVQGDVNGDSVSDFELLVTVTDADPITASDFFL